MKCSNLTTPIRKVSLGSALALGVAVSALYSTDAQALSFDMGSWSGSWDTTVSYGVGVRLGKPDKKMYSKSAGGDRISANADDGNLNFKQGSVFSNALRLSTELEIATTNFGAFFRVNALYDDVIANDRVSKRAYGNHLPVAQGGDGLNRFKKIKFTKEAKDIAGERIELFDAYIFGDLELGEMPVTWRLGNQVLSWGESTFIQNNINAINPIDVSKLRVPGSELKEAFIPVPLASVNIGLTEGLSMDMFYQIAWEPFRIDPTGTLFSSSDYPGPGGGSHGVMLGDGMVADYGQDKLGANPVLAPDGKADLAVPRGKDIEAKDDGQFGLAFRFFAPSLNDTEFGFYAMNYHSRLPIVSARTASDERMTKAFGSLNTAKNELIAAVTPGVTAAVMANNSIPAAQKLAAINAGVTQEVTNRMNNISKGVLLNSMQLGDGGYRYIIEYPEDIQLYGLSFNTLLGNTALQGEFSYRQDLPLQIDDNELLQSAMAAAGNSAVCEDARRIGQAHPMYPVCAVFAENAKNNYVGNFKPGKHIEGFRRKDVSQLQLTATRAFSNVLFADQAFLVGEVGITHIHKMEKKDEFLYEVDNGDKSGNPKLTSQHPNPADVTTPEPHKHFADPTSWGYIIAGKLEYLNAIGAVNLMPTFSYSHDVEGNTPIPIANFVEGRRSASIGLDFAYGAGLTGGIQYTGYLDNLITNSSQDKDFASFNISYAF